jgi:GNAT superfamily N-acetyltransferase
VIGPTDKPDGPLRAAYKALGYRLRTTEPFMVHDLRQIPAGTAPARIERVLTTDGAARLAKAARQRPMAPKLLVENASVRQYVAWMDDEPVGWTRSVALGNATWCSSMFVRPEFRRLGIARALLGKMLRDDRAGGATLAVLLASHAGAKLYPTVGYRQIGTLLFLTPPRRSNDLT